MSAKASSQDLIDTLNGIVSALHQVNADAFSDFCDTAIDEVNDQIAAIKLEDEENSDD